MTIKEKFETSDGCIFDSYDEAFCYEKPSDLYLKFKLNERLKFIEKIIKDKSLIELLWEEGENKVKLEICFE